MRIISRTLRKIVIEVHKKEIEIHGFDLIWDRIRNVYKIDDFEIFSIEHDKKTGSVVFVELAPRSNKV